MSFAASIIARSSSSSSGRENRRFDASEAESTDAADRAGNLGSARIIRRPHSDRMNWLCASADALLGSQ